MASEMRSGRTELAGSGNAPARGRNARAGILRKEGEYWTVGYGGKTFRLRDTKGLGYLAHLLRHPGVEFHVLDLFGGIASGREDDVLVRLANGVPIGTELAARDPVLTARKQWLADHLQLKGRLMVDAGAVRAVREEGKSLLPVGVLQVQGDFARGDVVCCVGPDGVEVARGLANYSSAEARQIARRPSSEIASILGFIEEPELIHRDNLVVL